MKLKRLPCDVARLHDEEGQQWLRLNTGGDAYVWYRPTEFGFVVLNDREADRLERAYMETLS